VEWFGFRPANSVAIQLKDWNLRGYRQYNERTYEGEWKTRPSLAWALAGFGGPGDSLSQRLEGTGSGVGWRGLGALVSGYELDGE
jgi:hypothetical protein